MSRIDSYGAYLEFIKTFLWLLHWQSSYRCQRGKKRNERLAVVDGGQAKRLPQSKDIWLHVSLSLGFLKPPFSLLFSKKQVVHMTRSCNLYLHAIEYYYILQFGIIFECTRLSSQMKNARIKLYTESNVLARCTAHTPGKSLESMPNGKSDCRSQ